MSRTQNHATVAENDTSVETTVTSADPGAIVSPTCSTQIQLSCDWGFNLLQIDSLCILQNLAKDCTKACSKMVIIEMLLSHLWQRIVEIAPPDFHCHKSSCGDSAPRSRKRQTGKADHNLQKNLLPT